MKTTFSKLTANISNDLLCFGKKKSSCVKYEYFTIALSCEKIVRVCTFQMFFVRHFCNKRQNIEKLHVVRIPELKASKN